MNDPQRSLRVVHWCPHLMLSEGVARAVLALARSQKSVGAEPLVVAPLLGTHPNGDTDLDPAAVQLWRPRWGAHAGNMALHWMRGADIAKVRAFGPDIVHVHAEFNPDNLRVPRVFEAPIVLSPHGAFHPLVRERSVLGNKSLYAWAAGRVLYRHVRRFHALTDAEADHVAHLLPGASIYVTPWASTIAAPATRPPGDVEQVLFLFLGRLDVYTKGLDLLVESFARTARELPDRHVELLMVGPDSRGGREQLTQRARDMGIGDRVHMPGTASRSEVEDLLARASAYVQLSRHEGLSMSVCEALTAGVPTVLTEASCPSPEIARLQQVKLVEPTVESATAGMIDLVRNIESYTAAAHDSLPTLRRYFSWERIAREHVREYRGVICPDSPAAPMTPLAT